MVCFGVVFLVQEMIGPPHLDFSYAFSLANGDQANGPVIVFPWSVRHFRGHLARGTNLSRGFALRDSGKISLCIWFAFIGMLGKWAATAREQQQQQRRPDQIDLAQMSTKRSRFLVISIKQRIKSTNLQLIFIQAPTIKKSKYISSRSSQWKCIIKHWRRYSSS